jgi:hypothetical protein
MVTRTLKARQRRVAALAVGAFLIAVAPLVVTAIGTRAQAGTPIAGRAQGPDVALSARLAVLRRPVAATDAVPPRWQRQITAVPGGFGAPDEVPDFAAARRVVHPAGATFWIVPSDDGLCVLEEAGDGAGFGCSSADDVLAGRAYAVSRGTGYGLPADAARVSGLMPDGASQVVLVTRDGAEHPALLDDNAYAVVVSGAPERIEWRDGAGVRHSAGVGAN